MGAKWMVGMKEYHGKMMWSWLAGWLAHLAVDEERWEIAEGLFSWLFCGQTKRHGRINAGDYISEVHEPTGEIVSSLLYTSETPFGWGSGYVLAASNAFLERQRP